MITAGSGKLHSGGPTNADRGELLPAATGAASVVSAGRSLALFARYTPIQRIAMNKPKVAATTRAIALNQASLWLPQIKYAIHSVRPLTAASAWPVSTSGGSRVAEAAWKSLSYSISQMIARNRPKPAVRINMMRHATPIALLTCPRPEADQ